MKLHGWLLIFASILFATSTQAHDGNFDTQSVIHACSGPDGQMRVINVNDSCRKSETPLHLQKSANTTGGGTLVFEKTWKSVTTVANAWGTVTGSAVTATTSGAPLLINVNLNLVNGSHATCRPIVDGQWAGSFGNAPSSPSDPFWTEGLQAVGANGLGWKRWISTRVYTNIPAGSHTFELQCATDGGFLTIGDASSVPNHWNVIELRSAQ